MASTKAKTAKDSVGILVLREFVRPAGWINPGDAPFVYEKKRMYTNPDVYLQWLANYDQGYDTYGRKLIEDHRTPGQYEYSRKKIGPWVWGGLPRG